MDYMEQSYGEIYVKLLDRAEFSDHGHQWTVSNMQIQRVI